MRPGRKEQVSSAKLACFALGVQDPHGAIVAKNNGLTIEGSPGKGQACIELVPDGHGGTGMSEEFTLLVTEAFGALSGGG